MLDAPGGSGGSGTVRVQHRQEQHPAMMSRNAATSSTSRSGQKQIRNSVMPNITADLPQIPFPGLRLIDPTSLVYGMALYRPAAVKACRLASAVQ